MLTSLFSLFYVTGEFHRFLHRGRATNMGGVNTNEIEIEIKGNEGEIN